VERYVYQKRKKYDLYGCFDLVAVSFEGNVDFVQVTGSTGHASHKRKMLANPAARRIAFGSSARVVLVSWGKRRERGRDGGRLVWKPRIEVLGPVDFLEFEKHQTTSNKSTGD